MKSLKFVALSLALSISSFAVQAESQFVLGKDYEIMSPVVQTEPLVEEFFNYACGACYQAEIFSQDFKAKHPDVQFKYIPAEIHAEWKIYVEAYYIAEKLGVLDKSHSKLFNRIHVERKHFKDQDDMKAFFVELGVDPAEYDKVAGSYWLKTQVRQAKQYSFANKVIGTPSYLVNKRIKLDRKNLGTTERLEQAILEFARTAPSAVAEQ